MKKALIMYTHGLGDVIMLTPHLRHFYRQGYVVDLMCNPNVISSHLVDACPYVGRLIPITVPWVAYPNRRKMAHIVANNFQKFDAIKDEYDWVGKSLHKIKRRRPKLVHKIDLTSRELGISLQDKHLEVFISQEAEDLAQKYIASNHPNGYVFVHTDVEYHPCHTWDSSDYVENKYKGLDVVNTGAGGANYRMFDDINASFVLAREACARIISSSVFLPACDAMNCVMDVVSFGKKDRKVWPLDPQKILRIRERGKWIK